MSTVRTAFILTAAFYGSTTWAQQVDAFLGLGTARVGSNGQSIDTFGDGTLYKAPAMGGVFTDFGFNLFLNRQVGIGPCRSCARASASRASTLITTTRRLVVRSRDARPRTISSGMPLWRPVCI